MPQIQLGLYMVSRSEARSAVLEALSVGYRGFDCAQMYHNERETGEALRAALAGSHSAASSSEQGNGRSSRPGGQGQDDPGNKSAASLTRQNIFYTTKLAQNRTSYDAVRTSIRKSVEACGLGYIDLFLLHSPYGGKEARLVSWRAVEDAIDAGDVRSGGVSNYGVAHVGHHIHASVSLLHLPALTTPQIEELMAVARIKPVVNQIESHPFNTRNDIREVCARHGIVVEAYAPLVRGMRMKHRTLTALARTYGCTPAQLLMRWSLQHGMVPLPKSVWQARMVENADVNGFAISAADMATLDGLDEHLVTDW